VPFIIIPAGELLLPVAIKFFPNMLPSTFESKFAVEEKRRGLIKVRLEMAKFLQETIREGGIQAADKVQTSDEFKEFFRKVSAGEGVKTWRCG
jgi:LETM1 and EF-hand domain-containing protein 1